MNTGSCDYGTSQSAIKEKNSDGHPIEANGPCELVADLRPSEINDEL